MNCPSCQRGLPAGPHERCPFCATLINAPVEGALAPEPRLEAAEKVEPLREIPGLRRREPTWKDEVRERVRQRKQQRGVELPLFPEDEAPPEAVEQAAPSALGDDDGADGAPAGGGLTELGDPPSREDDLPLRPAAQGRGLDASPRDLGAELAGDLLDGALEGRMGDPLEDASADRGWAAPEPARRAAPPVERPARAFERAQAALLDLVLLLGMWCLVVYFASRAAHVTLEGLLPSWPYLAGYLAALGLLYAGYFTGTTGQTLGKIVFGLRVVDAAGQPPGYLRASARAALGSLGVVLGAGALVPMAFDPARRALHDRLLRTRVVKG